MRYMLDTNMLIYLIKNKPPAIAERVNALGSDTKQCMSFVSFAELRDAETANVPFLTALTSALRRYPSFMWQATLHSGRLALHPTSTAIKRYISNFRIPKLCILPSVLGCNARRKACRAAQLHKQIPTTQCAQN